MYSQKETRTVQIHTGLFPRFSLQYMNYGCRDTRTQKTKKRKQEYKKRQTLENKKEDFGPDQLHIFKQSCQTGQPRCLRVQRSFGSAEDGVGRRRT